MSKDVMKVQCDNACHLLSEGLGFVNCPININFSPSPQSQPLQLLTQVTTVDGVQREASWVLKGLAHFREWLG